MVPDPGGCGGVFLAMRTAPELLGWRLVLADAAK